jgi:hypothetical protein
MAKHNGKKSKIEKGLTPAQGLSELDASIATFAKAANKPSFVRIRGEAALGLEQMNIIRTGYKEGDLSIVLEGQLALSRTFKTAHSKNILAVEAFQPVVDAVQKLPLGHCRAKTRPEQLPAALQ